MANFWDIKDAAGKDLKSLSKRGLIDAAEYINRAKRISESKFDEAMVPFSSVPTKMQQISEQLSDVRQQISIAKSTSDYSSLDKLYLQRSQLTYDQMVLQQQSKLDLISSGRINDISALQYKSASTAMLDEYRGYLEGTKATRMVSTKVGYSRAMSGIANDFWEMNRYIQPEDFFSRTPEVLKGGGIFSNRYWYDLSQREFSHPQNYRGLYSGFLSDRPVSSYGIPKAAKNVIETSFLSDEIYRNAVIVNPNIATLPDYKIARTLDYAEDKVFGSANPLYGRQMAEDPLDIIIGKEEAASRQAKLSKQVAEYRDLLKQRRFIESKIKHVSPVSRIENVQAWRRSPYAGWFGKDVTVAEARITIAEELRDLHYSIRAARSGRRMPPEISEASWERMLRKEDVSDFVNRRRSFKGVSGPLGDSAARQMTYSQWSRTYLGEAMPGDPSLVVSSSSRTQAMAAKDAAYENAVGGVGVGGPGSGSGTYSPDEISRNMSAKPMSAMKALAAFSMGAQFSNIGETIDQRSDNDPSKTYASVAENAGYFLMAAGAVSSGTVAGIPVGAALALTGGALAIGSNVYQVAAGHKSLTEAAVLAGVSVATFGAYGLAAKAGSKLFSPFVSALAKRTAASKLGFVYGNQEYTVAKAFAAKSGVSSMFNAGMQKAFRPTVDIFGKKMRVDAISRAALSNWIGIPAIQRKYAAYIMTPDERAAAGYSEFSLASTRASSGFIKRSMYWFGDTFNPGDESTGPFPNLINNIKNINWMEADTGEAMKGPLGIFSNFQMNAAFSRTGSYERELMKDTRDQLGHQGRDWGGFAYSAGMDIANFFMTMKLWSSIGRAIPSWGNALLSKSSLKNFGVSGLGGRIYQAHRAYELTLGEQNPYLMPFHSVSYKYRPYGNYRSFFAGPWSAAMAFLTGDARSGMFLGHTAMLGLSAARTMSYDNAENAALVGNLAYAVSGNQSALSDLQMHYMTRFSVATRNQLSYKGLLGIDYFNRSRYGQFHNIRSSIGGMPFIGGLFMDKNEPMYKLFRTSESLMTAGIAGGFIPTQDSISLGLYHMENTLSTTDRSIGLNQFKRAIAQGIYPFPELNTLEKQLYAAKVLNPHNVPLGGIQVAVDMYAKQAKNQIILADFLKPYEKLIPKQTRAEAIQSLYNISYVQSKQSKQFSGSTRQTMDEATSIMPTPNMVNALPSAIRTFATQAPAVSQFVSTGTVGGEMSERRNYMAMNNLSSITQAPAMFSNMTTPKKDTTTWISDASESESFKRRNAWPELSAISGHDWVMRRASREDMAALVKHREWEKDQATIKAMRPKQHYSLYSVVIDGEERWYQQVGPKPYWLATEEDRSKLVAQDPEILSHVAGSSPYDKNVRIHKQAGYTDKLFELVKAVAKGKVSGKNNWYSFKEASVVVDGEEITVAALDADYKAYEKYSRSINIRPDYIYVDPGTGMGLYSDDEIQNSVANSIREWNFRSPRRGGEAFGQTHDRSY